MTLAPTVPVSAMFQSRGCGFYSSFSAAMQPFCDSYNSLPNNAGDGQIHGDGGALFVTFQLDLDLDLAAKARYLCCNLTSWIWFRALPNRDKVGMCLQRPHNLS